MPADAGRITAQIDGDISGLKSALGQARSEATSAVSGIEGSFKSGLGTGLRDSMSGIAASMGPVGSALSAIGPAGIAAGAGIAVVGSALSSSITTAAGFQQQMAGVGAILGTTGPELEALSNAAREAGASTQYSASQAAEALSYMAGAGWDSQQATAGLKDTLTMAAAGGMDLASAGDLMTNTIAQFNLEATNSGQVANVLAAGAAETNTNIAQLGGGLKEVGATAAAFGMSLESTTAALGALSNAGIKGAEGGTALRGILAGLASQSGPAAEALAELGISAEQINPATVGVADAMELLNEKGMTATQALKIFGRENVSAATYLAAHASSLDGLETSITGTSKATEMAATMTDTYEGAMGELSSAVEEAQIALGSVLLPVVTDVVEGFTVAVNATTEFGKGIYDLGSGFSAMFSEAWNGGSLADIDKAFLSAMGADTGEQMGDQLAEGVAESDDLKAAPGEALGSPEALNAVGDAAEAAGETYEQRINRQIGEWKENFVGEIFGEKGNLDDRIKGQVEIGGGLFTAVDYDINNEYGNYKLNTPTGSIEYSSLDEMKEKAPEDIAAYIGRELTDLEKAQAQGDTQLAIRLQANPEVEFRFDFDINKALSFSPESERGAMYNMLLTTLNNAGTDAATESARTTAEEYGKALQEVDWANLPGLQAAAAKLKAAKGELYSGVGDKSWADLIDNQTEAYKDALMAQITDIAEFTQQQGETLAGSISDAFSDALLTEDERALIVAMEPMLDMLAAEAPEEFEKSGMAAILSFIDAVKSGASSAELDTMWDTIMGKMDSKTEEAKSKLRDGSGMFYGDFMTQPHGYTDYVNEYGGYVGPTQYYDDYIAQKQGQISGALAALQNVEDIQVGLKVDTTQGERDISSFKSTTEKENIDKPLKIDRTKASEEIALVDKAITAAMVKPISLSGVETVMGQIAAIDAAAAKPVIKPIYLQMGYGSAGGAGGDSGNTWGDWMPSFANEGYVRSPTLAVIGDRPGGEYVVGAARFEAAASKIRSGGAPQITIHYNPMINGSGLSSDELSRVLEDHDEKLINKIVEAKEWG
jgi:TP901 family phage tail tape measure protein